MALRIYCSDTHFPDDLDTNICGIYNAKLILTVISCLVFLALGGHHLRKYKLRCHKTLLTFHNLRAAVALLLLAINTLELARSLLPTATPASAATPTSTPPTTTITATAAAAASKVENVGSHLSDTGKAHNYSIAELLLLLQPSAGNHENDLVWLIIGARTVWNALAAIWLTIMLMWYHRIVERKKLKGFLYISAVLALLISFVRIYELSEVVYYVDANELESCLLCSTALCLLALSVIDGFTVYKERYRPNYLEDYEKIGYKHTLATFYSKSCFWWLTSLLWFGYKEPLELEDLGQMRLEDSARAHYDRFLLIYKTAKGKNANGPPSLWYCYIKNSWRMFTLGGILKLFGDLFALIGPLAIQQIVQYIEILYGAHNAAAVATAATSATAAAQQIAMPQSSGRQLRQLQSSDKRYISNNTSIGPMAANLYNISARLAIGRRATGSIWLANPDSSNSNSGDDYDNGNDNGIVYNQIGSNGLNVKIYYATWLDLISNGWAIAWLVLLAALTQAALSQASTHLLNMTGIRIKTSLQGLIYRKTLLLNSSCSNSSSNNTRSNTNNSNASHVAVDGDNVADGVTGVGMPAAAAAAAAATAMQNGVKAHSEKLTMSVDNHHQLKPLSIQTQTTTTAATTTTTTATRTATRATTAEVTTESKLNTMELQAERVSCFNDIGAITNLMTEDTLNIMSFFWIAHYVWAIPLKIALVVYLLYLKLGISAVIGALVCILTMTPLQFLIGKAMTNNNKVIAQHTDKRLKQIHDAIIGIKVIKLNAWDDVFLKKITAARQKELKYLNKDALYWSLMTILTHVSTVLITFVTLAVYVCLPKDADMEFTASHLFSALALFQQMTVPLLIFPVTVPIIISAVVSTKRLEEFLHAREIQKQFEGIRNMARILSKSDASLDMYEVYEKSNMTMRTAQAENKLNERLALRIQIPEPAAPLAQSEPMTPTLPADVGEVAATLPTLEQNEPAAVESTPMPAAQVAAQVAEDEQPPPECVCMRDCDLKWYEKRHSTIVQHRRELLRNTPYVAIRPRKLAAANTMSAPGHAIERPEFSAVLARNTDSWRRDSLLLKMSDDIAVSINNGVFTWQPGQRSVLMHVNEISIPKGKLTVVVGKNDSGKSSLLNALLMEMPLVSGNMFWHKTSTISYVPQQPWLLNTSIRENILFGESFRPKRYDFVLDACALKPDIELMPDADLTVIGERGINLSGGQRQRVAVARAIYSSANVVIMDDPLSSLDNEVAHHVFEHCIRDMLLKSNRTIILVTQQLQLVQQADYLIVMKDGSLLASGSYKDIEVTHPHIIAKWNSIIAKANEKEQQNQAALGRTARERWKLFKNVSKLGLQRSISLTAETTTSASAAEYARTELDGSSSLPGGMAPIATIEDVDIVADDDDDMLPVNLANNTHHTNGFSHVRKRAASFYGSRHLIYDVPLPIDECQTEDVILRRRRRGTLTRRSSSRASSSSQRLSGISSASTATTTSDVLRRSLLTASGSSYASSTLFDANDLQQQHHQQQQQETRVHSWQPQTAYAAVAAAADADADAAGCGHVAGDNKMQHQPVKRNASSPPSLHCAGNRDAGGMDVATKSSSTLLSHAATTTTTATATTTIATTAATTAAMPASEGGFQQFLRRMSMRRSNKPNVVNIAHRKQHSRPLSATNSILSISEETPAIASLPSIELSSVASSNAEAAMDDVNAVKVVSWVKDVKQQATGDTEVINMGYKAMTNDANRMENECNGSDNNDGHDDNGTANSQQEVITITPTTKTTTATATTVAATTTIASTGATESINYCHSIFNSIYNNNNNNNNNNKYNNHSHVRGNHDVERKYGKISNRIYLLYMRASGLPIIIVFFITALIWQCLRVYTDVWLQHWTDNNNNNAVTHMHAREPTNFSNRSSMSDSWQLAVGSVAAVGDEHDDVTYYFCVYALISCVCIIMSLISTPAGQWAGCNARRNLHDKLLHTIMRKSLHFFQVTPLGRIVNRFSNDMAIIDKKIAATSQRLLQFSLLCLCAILINVSVTPWFLLLTVPICAAYYAIQKFYRCSSRELQRIENATNSPVISHLSETIQGVTTIRAYNQEARFTEILFQRLEANTIAFTILNTSNRWLGISLDYLGGFIVFVAIVAALLTATISCSKQLQQETYDAASAVADADDDVVASGSSHSSYVQLTPTPSHVGLAINYTLLIPIYLNWVVKLFADMEMYAGSVERIAYYAEEDEEEEEEEEDESSDEADVERVSSSSSADSTEITNEVDMSSSHVDHVLLVEDASAPAAAVAAAALTQGNANVTATLAVVAKQQQQQQQQQEKDDEEADEEGKEIYVADKTKLTARRVAAVGRVADDVAAAVHNDRLNARLPTSDEASIKDALLGNRLKRRQRQQPQPQPQQQHMQPTAVLTKQIVVVDDEFTAPAIAAAEASLTNAAAIPYDNVERRMSGVRLTACKKYKTVPISWPQRGDISFENVCLRYEGQRQHVIENLTLKIPAGQRIGICGRTGSGKSSLALSLFGVLETTSGRIRIDDVDITQIHPDEIRTRLSIIPQDVHLFNATIRENLDPHGYYTDLPLWNCLELAQLKEFVNGQMPQGLDTEITDGGINLSAGHRQLLCLARAILRGSVCLVLDEATSTLDTTTERALLAAAHKAFQGRTIITIAHRLSTILDYDRIIILEHGKIIEDGAPQDLQHQQDSVFYALLHAGKQGAGDVGEIKRK